MSKQAKTRALNRSDGAWAFVSLRTTKKTREPKKTGEPTGRRQLIEKPAKWMKTFLPEFRRQASFYFAVFDGLAKVKITFEIDKNDDNRNEHNFFNWILDSFLFLFIFLSFAYWNRVFQKKFN